MKQSGQSTTPELWDELWLESICSFLFLFVCLSILSFLISLCQVCEFQADKVLRDWWKHSVESLSLYPIQDEVDSPSGGKIQILECSHANHCKLIIFSTDGTICLVSQVPRRLTEHCHVVLLLCLSVFLEWDPHSGLFASRTFSKSRSDADCSERLQIPSGFLTSFARSIP